MRAKQRAFMARYGRQSWFAWDEHATEELDEACEALVELMSDESGAGRMTEDL